MSFFNEAVDWFERVQGTPFYRDLLQKFAGFLELTPEIAVLDVGCGPGYLTRLIAQRAKSAACVDIAPRMVERAREHAAEKRIENIQHIVGSAENIPFESGYFDLAVATSVIYLVRNPVRALKEMARVVKAGGRIVMMNPSDKMTYENVSTVTRERRFDGREAAVLEGWLHAAEGARRFSEQSATKTMERAGLTQVSHERHLNGAVLFSKAVKP